MNPEEYQRQLEQLARTAARSQNYDVMAAIQEEQVRQAWQQMRQRTPILTKEEEISKRHFNSVPVEKIVELLHESHPEIFI